MKPIRLRVEHLAEPKCKAEPLTIDVKNPLLSWCDEGGAKQTAYEISASAKGTEVWNSGRVESGAMQANIAVPYESRARYEVKVRVWDEKGQAGEWSEPLSFEYGLLNATDWQAKWINPEEKINKKERQPGSYLKKSFTLSEDAKNARLYITAHGIYEAYLNGQRVGEIALAPGRDSYFGRLQYQCYDVTDLLRKEGENELQVVLGDGWFRGNNGINGVNNIYGSRLGLLAQLEVGGAPVAVTDKTWVASQNGPLRFSDTEIGEIYDARQEESSEWAWHPVQVTKGDYKNLVCADCVPTREHEVFEGKIFQTPNGEWVADFGQNMAGYTELQFTAKAGQKLTLWHGESLDENGNFTQANFAPGERNKNGGVPQKLEYICKEGINHYKMGFAVFGFRYAKIEAPEIDLAAAGAKVSAHALYSDMEEVARFECSNADVNQLFKNSVWSMKSNFVEVPTDCPTRERSGWNGDAGVFVHTGAYLMDSYSIYRKWSKNCALEQLPNGVLWNTVPADRGKMDILGKFMSGSAGWADGNIIVPYTLYKVYGDIEILKENYPMMRKWQEYAIKRARKNNNRNKQFKGNPQRHYIVETGFHWGEWCEPDLDCEANLRNTFFTGQPVLATAYFARTSEMMSEIAALLNEADDAARYKEAAERATLAYRSIALTDGKIESARQCDYVRPLAFGLLENAEQEKACAKALNALVVARDYHLNTGFLTTPYLCEVLAKHGYAETAYKLLLQDTVPGWLYSVKKGATTIWENWDGISEDGHVKASLNHYSYGAISGWLLRGVCGIQVEDNKITVAPTTNPALHSAKASFQSPIGLIESGWHYEGTDLVYEITIPANVEAKFVREDGKSTVLSSGKNIIKK